MKRKFHFRPFYFVPQKKINNKLFFRLKKINI